MEDIKTIGIDVTNKTLRQILNEQASIMPSLYDTSNWCYMPLWFQVTNDRIISFNLNQLPENIKNQINKLGEISTNSK